MKLLTKTLTCFCLELMLISLTTVAGKWLLSYLRMFHWRLTSHPIEIQVGNNQIQVIHFIFLEKGIF